MRVIRLLLAGLALVAGLLAGIAASAAPPLADDEISAVVLARWIADRRPGLQLVDLRGQAEFDVDHLPGAVPLARADAAALPAADTTLVIYSDDSIKPDAVPQRLAGRDRQTILRLRGGLQAWSDEVLFPTIRSDASAARRRAFDERARLSRYFGGSPRVLEPGVDIGQPRSRRGC
ncbi:rhodanese-like domain-containing protein [Lysobacter sp. D1-1-M9]|uniref:rhodanese-like domain-containing protein n=1 Tax=Novilysobacter longmucuonensis TaxID=3098603 RepID=UPI002FC99FA8